MSRTAQRTRRRAGWQVLAAGALVLSVSPALFAHEVPENIDSLREKPTVQPAVQDEIRKLRTFHIGAKRAADRLVEQGNAVLPALHAAMLAADADPVQSMQLATVVGEIGDVSSTVPLIALARTTPDHAGVQQTVLDMLAQLDPSPEAIALADELLANAEVSWRVRRKALVYLGQQRVAAAARWVETYRQDPQLELRAGALYLAARLGDAAALEPMTEMLGAPAPPSLRYALMLGIAELVGPDEFRTRTPEWIRDHWEYESALRYARLRSASDAPSDETIRRMISSKALFERQIAARYLLEHAGAEALAEMTRSNVPPQVRSAARHELRRAGHEPARQDDGSIDLRRKDRP